MQLQEKPWPHQPEIDDNAILYLDNLAVYYFLHTGILEKLCKLEFKLCVSSSLVSELNALIAYERISSRVIDAIENMRSVVRQGIECGKVKVGKWRNVSKREEQSITEHQIVGLLALAEDCNAIVVDDRFFNQHQSIEHHEFQVPLFSMLELLDALVSVGSISPQERQNNRTRLRRAGYFFVPVSEDELTCHLISAEVRNGKVIERAHLKAIRESLLHVRMNDWLQLPREGSWPGTIFDVFVKVLRNLWREGADVFRVEALSNWIWDQVDFRGWAHCFEPETRNEIIKSGRGRIIFLLLTPFDADVPQNIREAYWVWLEDRVLAPIKELEPDLYAMTINLERRQISELADTDLTEVEQHDE